MSGLTVSGSPRIGAMVRPSFTAMTPAERTGKPRPFGFFLSLGHSSVVVAIGAAIIVAERTVFPAICLFIGGIEVLSLLTHHIAGSSRSHG